MWVNLCGEEGTAHDLDLHSYFKLFLFFFLCPMLLSGVTLGAPLSHLAVLPRVDFSLEKTQPYLGSLEAASIQIWSLRVFLCLTQIFQARDKVCQQMWSVCAASPGLCQGLCACYRDTKGRPRQCSCLSPPSSWQSQNLGWGTTCSKSFWKCGPTCKGELQELP